MDRVFDGLLNLASFLGEERRIQRQLLHTGLHNFIGFVRSSCFSEDNLDIFLFSGDDHGRALENDKWAAEYESRVLRLAADRQDHQQTVQGHQHFGLRTAILPECHFGLVFSINEHNRPRSLHVLSLPAYPDWSLRFLLVPHTKVPNARRQRPLPAGSRFQESHSGLCHRVPHWTFSDPVLE